MKKTMYRLALAVTVASLVLTNGSLFASETDDQIESAAKQSYVFKTYLEGDDIKISSQNGVVTLTGTVSEESNKSLACETIKGLPGVESVDDKLEVISGAPAAYSDAWLMTKVKTALLFHRNVSAIETEVSAEDGSVTLSGEADSEAQKDLVTEYVKDVDGVKDVKNDMTVSTTAMKSAEKTMSKKIEAMTEAIDDASITAMAKMTLLYHRSTSGLDTTVETKDGVVTLGGKAGSAAEKDLAAKFVNDVHGVKNVVNTMTIGWTGAR